MHHLVAFCIGYNFEINFIGTLCEIFHVKWPLLKSESCVPIGVIGVEALALI